MSRLPLEAPWARKRAFVVRARRRAEWDRLAGRRADFRAAGVPDCAATNRELHRARPADRAAALRVRPADHAAALRVVVLGWACPPRVAAVTCLHAWQRLRRERCAAGPGRAGGRAGGPAWMHAAGAWRARRRQSRPSSKRSFKLRSVSVALVAGCERMYLGAAALAVSPARVAATRLLEGPDGDMRRRLTACLPWVRWMPAHQDAPEGGANEAEWLCNRVADEAARAAAALALVPVWTCFCASWIGGLTLGVGGGHLALHDLHATCGPLPQASAKRWPWECGCCCGRTASGRSAAKRLLAVPCAAATSFARWLELPSVWAAPNQWAPDAAPSRKRGMGICGWRDGEPAHCLRTGVPVV